MIDEPMNQSKVFGTNSRMMGESTNGPFGRTDGDKSKLRFSRSNSRVLSRSRSKIEESSRNIISTSRQINTPSSMQRSMQRSKTYGLGMSRK